MIHTETTAENLKEIRTQRGLTQDDVSAVLGLNKYHLSNIENGRRALSDTEKKILDWHFFGTVPPRLAEPSLDMQTILDFEEHEWAILAAMARREGVTEAAFIAGRIRSYLAFYDSLKGGQNVTEIVSFPAPKAHILAAAGSPISAEVTDWDGADDTVMVKINGLSMFPMLNDGDVIAMKHKRISRNPYMKKGLIYLVNYDGGYTVKRYNTRPAIAEEKGEEWVEAGKVKVLESVNPEFPEIIIKQPLEWVAWLQKP